MTFQVASALIGFLGKKMPAIRLYVVSTGSMIVGIGAQSLAFVIIARHLGKVQFGQLTVITAAAALGAAWAQLGSAECMRRRVGRDASAYRRVLGHCIVIIFGWGSVLAVGFAVAISLYTHVAGGMIANFGVIYLFIVCNLVMFPWMTLVEQIFLAHDDFYRANLTNAGFGAVRAVTAVVACLGFGVDTLSTWALWNFAAYLLGSIAGAIAISGYGRPRLGILRGEIAVGVTFGISGFLSNLRAYVDVLSLSAIASAGVVGTYGLARRVIAIAVVTAASLDRLVYSRLAVAGKGGPAATLRLGYRYAIYAFGLAAATSFALYIMATPVLPLLFGTGFIDAIGILKALCWILPLLALQNVAFDALNAANMHRLQTTISTAAVLIGASILTLLTFKFSIAGTVAGVYIMETLLMLALWAGLILVSKRR
jgi:O-antigen/teichoic acid export membrane protein